MAGEGAGLCLCRWVEDMAFLSSSTRVLSGMSSRSSSRNESSSIFALTCAHHHACRVASESSRARQVLASKQFSSCLGEWMFDNGDKLPGTAARLAQLHTPAKRELRSDVLSRRPAWKSIPEREAVRLPAYIHTPLHPIFRDNLARRHSSRHDSHAQFQRLIHHYTHLSGELPVLYAPPASACLPHTSAQTKILQAANCRFFT